MNLILFLTVFQLNFRLIILEIKLNISILIILAFVGLALIICKFFS